MTRYLSLCLAALALVALMGSGGRAASRYTLITVLHTNDMHGRVMPRGEPGGLVRAATLVRHIRSEMPNVLLLDAGDIIHGTPEDYFSGGRASTGAMNAAGYCLATAGNHEFDFGLPVMQGVMADASFPFVAANIRSAAGGQWDKLGQYAIMDVDGVRVAVLGITTLDVISLHWPNAIKDIVVEDPIATARELVPRLRSQSDVLIVLSHLGNAQDKVLAESVEGIDFIIGGHSHTVVSDSCWVGNTMISQAGSYGRALGRFDFITRSGDAPSEIVSVNGRNGAWCEMARPPLDKAYPRLPLIPVDDSIAEDEAIRAAYMPFREDADRRLAEVVGNAPNGMPGRATCPIESPAGDLVADAVRAFAGSDFAIIDSNSLAANGLSAGPVTVKSVFDLIGGYTRQHLVTAHVSGAGIRTGLDCGFARKNAINAAISGGSLVYEMKDGVPVISEFSIGGAPVDPNRRYTVSAQAYVMMDLMQVVPDVEVVTEHSETTREALADYIRKMGTLASGPLDRIKCGP